MNMSAKRQPSGGRRSKNVQETIEKLSAVERTFFGLRIRDLQRRLAYYDEYDIAIKENSKQMEDLINNYKTPTAAEKDPLSRFQCEVESMREENELAEKQLQETIEEYTDFLENNRIANEALQSKYDAMFKQLSMEERCKEAELQSIKDFIVMEEELIGKVLEHEQVQKEMEAISDDAAKDIRMNTTKYENHLREQVHQRLKEFMSKFVSQSETNLTRRMAHENFELERSFQQLESDAIKIDVQMKEDAEQQKQLSAQMKLMNAEIEEKTVIFEKNVKMIKSLIQRNRLVEISRLNYERLFQIYDNYKSKRKCLRHHRTAINQQKLENCKLDRDISVSIHTKKHMIDDIQRNIKIYQSLVEKSKEKILDSIGFLNKPFAPSKITQTDLNRYEEEWDYLIHAILHFIFSNIESTSFDQTADKQTSHASFDTRVQMEDLTVLGVDPIFELFTRGAVFKDIETMTVSSLALPEKPKISVIIPEERSCESHLILDVEKGSTLYVSSPHEQDEVEVVVEEEKEEEYEESSSESSVVAVEAAEQIKPETDAPPIAMTKDDKRAEHEQGDNEVSITNLIDVVEVEEEEAEEDYNEEVALRLSAGYRKDNDDDDDDDDDDSVEENDQEILDNGCEPDGFSEESYRLLFY